MLKASLHKSNLIFTRTCNTVFKTGFMARTFEFYGNIKGRIRNELYETVGTGKMSIINISA